MAAHDEANPASGYYVLPFTWNVAGTVNWAAFSAAFEEICARFPVLLATVRREGGSWIQEIRPFAEVPAELRDGTAIGADDREAWLQACYQEYCRSPFDLAARPAVRVLAVQLEEQFIVMGAAHMAACDIESQAIFTADLWKTYYALAEGAEPDLAPAPLGFPDYAQRVRDSSGAQQDKNLPFWQGKLRDAELLCPVPVDYQDGLRNQAGPTAYVKIGAQPLARQVHSLAAELKCSEHAVLLAAFTGMLARRSSRPSVVLSCPVSLRRSAELFGVFGPLTDMMWLRIDVKGTSVGQNARSVFKSVLDALSHPCAIDVIAAQAGGEPVGAVMPNIQCEYFPPERVAIPEWVTSSVKVKDVMPVYLLTGQLHSPFWLDLTIAGEHVQPDTDYSLVYRKDLFRPETVADMAHEIETSILQPA
jgi:hypothetical protein